MARKRKTRKPQKPKKPAFLFLKRGSSKPASKPVVWPKVFKGFAIALIPAAICAGLWFVDKWRRHIVPAEMTTVEAAQVVPLNVPPWAQDEIVPAVQREAIPAGGRVALDEHAAARILANLERFEWLYDARVRTTDRGFLVAAGYREPAGLVETRNTRIYVATDNVVLRYIPLTTLHIPRITGISSASLPATGRKWNSEEVAAAVQILASLRKMDESAAAGKPLLSEIESIDVSNLHGRRDARAPHIVLKTFDGTEIFWGAAMGAYVRYMEASDIEKLMQLYGFYREPLKFDQQPTLQNSGVRYIDLRHPRTQVPRPGRS